MGDKRLDKEAIAREGEPLLASAIARPVKAGKDAVLRLIGAVPVIGDFAEVVGEVVPLGDDEPKAPDGYKRLSISLPSRMYLTLSASRLTLYMLGARYKLGEAVFTVPPSYVAGITTKRNWSALPKYTFFTMNVYNESIFRATFFLTAGAPIELQAGHLELNEAAALILATGDAKSIRKMREALQGTS